MSILRVVLVGLLLVSDEAMPRGGPASALGAIEGVVSPRSGSPVRVVERYAGASGAPREVIAVPVVVFVEGLVPSAPAPRPSGRLEIVQRDENFSPALLVVPVGAEVRFPNDDPVFHNVFSYSRAARFDLGRYRRGESKTVVFERPGYIKVMCEIHKWMRAGVLVVENPYYAIVPEDGRFRIEGVPPGQYRLVAEDFDRRTRRVNLDVPDEGTARVEISF